MDAQATGSGLPNLKASALMRELPMDEMFEVGGRPRPECARVANYLLTLEAPRLAELGNHAHQMFQQMGVTFNHYGDADGAERIFPFDPVPRIIAASQWAQIEAGLIQRVRALNAFLADIYGEAAILHDGIVPRDLIIGSPQFRHAAASLQPHDRPFVTVAGIDLVRGADGRFLVLEDNARTPSGVSYVLQNRVIMLRLLPELLRALRVRSVEQYPADLLACLRELAPIGISDPVVAILTPGPYNSAFFEHLLLSQQMGVELVEGRDLVCAGHKLFMKTVYGLRRVHVLYRRVDDDYLDPVVFRADSLLGVAGLTATIRAGNVAIANAIGTGVADDKAVFAYTPAMIRYYLGEAPLLPIVETHLLRDPEPREHVLRNLDRFVIKPTGASGGYGVVIGPQASALELAQVRERIMRDPAAYIAQPMVQLSVHPTLAASGSGPPRLEPRHVDLRPFVLMGSKPRVLAGGLTRVALREGSLIVNSSQGGGSKDTWVLEDGCSVG
ncbi:MAG TPA: circularly permuted type 2 ATP-grasp protein [Candidatus Binataceae bacterium]|nr:circularly permuted type 2 ATP-grasp protein [Candidatus Binataceae bacterium]